MEKDYNTGAISVDALNHQKMVDTRKEKVQNVSNIIPDVVIEGDDTAEILVVGWGGTHGHLLNAVSNINASGKKLALAHFNYINPLQKNTEDVFGKFKKVVVCELNTGQFVSYLRSKVSGVEFLQYNKVQGQPFTVSELESHFNSLLK